MCTDRTISLQPKINFIELKKTSSRLAELPISYFASY